MHFAVGRNGSGKSNLFFGMQRFFFKVPFSLHFTLQSQLFTYIHLHLFAAIRFVLGDVLANPRPEERHQLLHVIHNLPPFFKKKKVLQNPSKSQVD